MPAAAIAFSTPRSATRWKRWLLYSPLARIVLFVALLVAVAFAVHAGFAALGWTKKTAPLLQRAVAGMADEVLAAVIAYLILVGGIERRACGELSPRDIPRHGGAGIATGLVLFSTVVLVLWLAGSYHVLGINRHVDWVIGVLVVGLGAGIGEEILLRGVLFRIVEEGLGTWWALAISAAVFGAAHISNPGATLWSSIAIMIEAGVLLALVYHVTRSLWACIGLHAAWNIAEGTIYGVSVSGTGAHGWLHSTLTGPAWLSGGKFGAEASAVAVVVCLIPSVVLLATALRRHSIVRPSWRRASTMVAEPGVLRK